MTTCCVDMDVATLNELEGDALLSLTEKKRMNTIARNIFRSLQDMAEKHRESLSSVFGQLMVNEDKEARDILGEIADMIVQEKGVGKAVKIILSDRLFQDFAQSMAVPDWVLVYFKLSARLYDEAWQMLLNLTRLGNIGVS